MIIWGTRSTVRTLAMLTLVCRNGHTSAHRLAERILKFTLFFVPLFPLSKKRFTVCTACGETLEISKEQAEQLLQQVAVHQAAQGGAPVGDPIAPPTSTALPPSPYPATRPSPYPQDGGAAS